MDTYKCASPSRFQMSSPPTDSHKSCHSTGSLGCPDLPLSTADRTDCYLVFTRKPDSALTDTPSNPCASPGLPENHLEHVVKAALTFSPNPQTLWQSAQVMVVLKTRDLYCKPRLISRDVLSRFKVQRNHLVFQVLQKKW